MPSPVAMSVVLSDDEREQLQAWARRPKSAQAFALRSRIVLACEGDPSNTQIARELGVTRGMVTKWRNRFAIDRLEGLLDEPRPGRPRVVEDAQIEALITATLETAPRDAMHWNHTVAHRDVAASTQHGHSADLKRSCSLLHLSALKGEHHWTATCLTLHRLLRTRSPRLGRSGR